MQINHPKKYFSSKSQLVANQELFKAASTTYYYSSLFFTPKIREAVSAFYAFVRTVDDFVDTTPQQIVKFVAFVEAYNRMYAGENYHQVQTQVWSHSQVDAQLTDRDFEVITAMILLQDTFGIKKIIIDSFLKAMEADIYKKTYISLEETVVYMYGSADVIGICMAKILDLPDSALEAAKLQGRAMQYINFIRDVLEDTTLGRQYLPATQLKKFGLRDLSKEECSQKPEQFSEFLRAQIDLYFIWQEEAERGYDFIPYRYRVPIITAAHMYRWTAKQIAKNPALVFEKKIKPTKSLVVAFGLWTCFSQLPIVRSICTFQNN